MKNGSILIEQTLSASIHTVWKAITDQEEMRQWYFNTMEEFNPQVGFQTQFNVLNGGKNYLHLWKVVDVVPPKKISYDWKYGGYPGNSLVTFELSSEGDKTKIRLTHEHLETFLPAVNPELAKEKILWRAGHIL